MIEIWGLWWESGLEAVSCEHFDTCWEFYFNFQGTAESCIQIGRYIIICGHGRLQGCKTSYSFGFGWRVIRPGAWTSLSSAPTGLCQPQQARGKKAGWLTSQLPCVLPNRPNPGDRARQRRSAAGSRLFLLRSSPLAPFLPSVFVVVGSIVL